MIFLSDFNPDEGGGGEKGDALYFFNVAPVPLQKQKWWLLPAPEQWYLPKTVLTIWYLTQEGPRGLPVIPKTRTADQDKEEEWERMMNPHNFGNERRSNYRLDEFIHFISLITSLQYVFLEAKLLYNSVLSFPHSLTHSLTPSHYLSIDIR